MTEISPLSVSEITEHIRAIVESDGALRRVYVRGELSNYCLLYTSDAADEL